MSALVNSRIIDEDRFKSVALPLATGVKAFQGGMACIDIVAASCKPGASGNANLIRVGNFADTFDNSAGTAAIPILVTLDHEIVLKYFDNDTGANAVTAANLFADVYILDDHTVTTASAGNSKAGRVWMIDTVKGIGVETYTL